MPSVKVKTNHGSVNFNYIVSTPSNENAKKIEPGLPTILFLHPVYIPMIIFHTQFGDPLTRRFNLVALDLLGHGETEAKIPKIYTQEDAADDIAKFMEALRLPPCYVFGLSMGTIIALQLAVSFPRHVLGLFLVSPLATEEPEGVAEGRREIRDCWIAGFDGKNVDEDALKDAIYGALQLGFNSEPNPRITATVAVAFPWAMHNWNAKSLEGFETITVEFFTHHHSQSKEALAKLQKIPIKIIYCDKDVAYGRDYLAEFEEQLQDAGCVDNVDIVFLDDAPHFGSATHEHLVNPLLHDFVANSFEGKIPPAPSAATSPWEAKLIKAGWHKDGSDDDDDF